MPIPDYETLMLPVLKLFASGAKNVSECVPAIKQQFAITDEEAEELLPSGHVTVLQSRTHWARTYLAKAGLLESPQAEPACDHSARHGRTSKESSSDR